MTNIFTTEETILMYIFDVGSRERLLSEMKESLPYMDEPEFIEIAKNVICKLQCMTDDEYTSIGFDRTENFEETED